MFPLPSPLTDLANTFRVTSNKGQPNLYQKAALLAKGIP